MLDQIDKMIEKLDNDKGKTANTYTVRAMLLVWKDTLKHWPDKAKIRQAMIQKGGNYAHAKRILDVCDTEEKMLNYIKSLMVFHFPEFKEYF